MKLNNKKILLVSNSSWSIYKFRLSLLNFLKNNNYEVISCAIHDDEYANAISKNSKFISISESNIDKNVME